MSASVCFDTSWCDKRNMVILETKHVDSVRIIINDDWIYPVLLRILYARNMRFISHLQIHCRTYEAHDFLSEHLHRIFDPGHPYLTYVNLNGIPKDLVHTIIDNSPNLTSVHIDLFYPFRHEMMTQLRSLSIETNLSDDEIDWLCTLLNCNRLQSLNIKSSRLRSYDSPSRIIDNTSLIKFKFKSDLYGTSPFIKQLYALANRNQQ